MEGEWISQMQAADPLDGTELVPVVQVGLNKKATTAAVGQLGTDHKAKVSPADQFAGFLQDKLAAGPHVTLTVLMPGVNELLEIAVTGVGTIAIGEPVSGGSSFAVLYVDSLGRLANDPNFSWNPANLGLQVVWTLGTGEAITGIAGTFEGALAANGGPGAQFGVAATDGVHVVYLCDGTNNITYTAANPADWAGGVPPTDVWVALHRCAAALTVLGTPP